MTAFVLFLVGFILVLLGILPSGAQTPQPAPTLPSVGAKVWTRRRFTVWPTAQRGMFRPNPSAGISGPEFRVTPDSLCVVLSATAEEVRLKVYCDPLVAWLTPVQVSLTPTEFERLYGKNPLTLRSLYE